MTTADSYDYGTRCLIRILNLIALPWKNPKKTMKNGIEAGYCVGLTASNNLVYDTVTGLNNNRTDGVYVAVNNTIYNTTNGLRGYNYFASIENNIIVSASTNGIVGDGGGDQPAPDNNLFFANGTNVNAYTADASQVTGSDPLFTAQASSDFTLQEDSPAVGAGKTISWLTIDYDGATRPQGTNYDIGAYERLVSSDVTHKDGNLAYIFGGDETKLINSTNAAYVIKTIKLI